MNLEERKDMVRKPGGLAAFVVSVIVVLVFSIALESSVWARAGGWFFLGKPREPKLFESGCSVPAFSVALIAFPRI